MIYYITNESGEVVEQFDGIEVSIKDGHETHTVESIEDLPGIDNLDPDYTEDQ